MQVITCVIKKKINEPADILTSALSLYCTCKLSLWLVDIDDWNLIIVKYMYNETLDKTTGGRLA